MMSWSESDPNATIYLGIENPKPGSGSVLREEI